MGLALTAIGVDMEKTALSVGCTTLHQQYVMLIRADNETGGADNDKDGDDGDNSGVSSGPAATAALALPPASSAAAAATGTTELYHNTYVPQGRNLNSLDGILAQ